MTDPHDGARLWSRLRDSVGRAVVGAEEPMRLMTIALLADGHALLEDVPGVGKTLLARAFARALGLGFGRVQGTPDLLPTDVTGSSVLAFEAMKVLGHNGALVWTSITGGQQHHEIPADKVNLDWVLGNKLLLGTVNANYRHFEMGIADLALAEVTFPGIVEKVLTSPVDGLENYKEMMRLLVEDRSALKVYVNVAEER